MLLELDRPLEALAPPPGLTLGSLHRVPAQGLQAARHCTGYATPAFLRECAAGSHPEILRFEIGLPIVAPVSATQPLQPLDAGLALDGVFAPVLAVIDDGLPIVHPALLDPSGAPRCLALWDQDGPPLEGGLLDYGRLLSRPVVAQALRAHAPATGVPRDDGRIYEHLGLPRLRRRWTHGSAVLGLAALGAARPPGPVPHFIGVHLPRRTTDDTSGLSLGVHVLDALHFVLKQAEASAGRARMHPGAVVVNLSFGRFAGAHDGSGLLSAAIDELIELRNRAGLPIAVVLPAGNGHLSRGHARGELAPGASRRLTWRIQPDDRTPSFVELWPATPSEHGRADAGTRLASLTVTLHPPTGAACGPVGAGWQAVLADAAGGPIATVHHLRSGAAGDGPMVLLAVAPTFALDATTPTAPAGCWSIELRNDGADPLPIAAWIQRDDRFAGSALGGRPSRFEDTDYQRFDALGRPLDTDPPGSSAWVSRADTINPIATGRHAVVVGAREAATGRASPYSAAGAARPPQLTAVADAAATRPGILSHGTRAGSRVRANGTSLAAPQVARWLLEQVPRAPAAPGATVAPGGPPPWPPGPDWARQAVAQRLGPPQGVAAEPVPPPVDAGRGGAAALPSAADHP